ncbi:NAD(P)/FAD-dependent oxidoreductase [Kibdelosporangium phytohabitans]|uniref:NADH dehydrogenase n=1 Tax=Kibdelosporangium phytohabitans TaxID=860235 RepID=A0A0N7F347_9PSEU|nr:NAD(P)/FAD-dependent oxidoreductase [Kibdelosporangium phytohabitans]ALG07623.1 NADH dehydrogenase [Kibdelosporangium phytohabitans]MBE1471427.1 NADH dehydrogenase [Kibdelosporangium phytohabitans]
MTHILIVGGGYVGMYTAIRLQRKLRAGEATVTVVDPQPNMTYQPFLPEAAAGSVEPRHVVVPLRRALPGCTVVTGKVTGIDHERKVATVVPAEGLPTSMPYDVLVMAAGSVARTLPIPGLAESGIGFATVGEAIYLRNHVLSRLDVASSTPERKQRALTFVVVGGGYAGVEVFGELEDMARYAMRVHKGLSPSDMRWVLVEAADRVLPEISPAMSDYTIRRLTKRGMEVKLGTKLVSMADGHVELSDGTSFDADTVVWTAGVKANPLAMRSGMPIDFRGRLICTETLQARGLQGVWGAGDSAAVPDLSGAGALCSPSAQHAVRQAKVLADNIIASMRGGKLKPYRHKHVGSVASLGLHKGVAQVYGIRLRGWPAWLMHRAYHWSRVPTTGRKLRVLLDWLTVLLSRREIVSLGQIQDPRRDWEVVVRETAHTLARNSQTQ